MGLHCPSCTCKSNLVFGGFEFVEDESVPPNVLRLRRPDGSYVDFPVAEEPAR